jgi:hypothetical protein
MRSMGQAVFVFLILKVYREKKGILPERSIPGQEEFTYSVTFQDSRLGTGITH